MNVCGFILIISLSSYYFSPCASNIDEEILCVYMKSCVLPCRFTPGTDLYIEWMKTEEGLTVHQFYSGQNQVLDQYWKYSDRTSLFEEEINRGNASLLLRDVTFKDQGRYLCLADDQVTFVNMKVFAPVSQVQVNSVRGDLHCEAHDIYPEPSLKWTMNPEPSAEPQTSVNPTETGLFSVHSSVPLPPDPPYKYICTVSTVYSTKSTTYEETYEESYEETAAEVSCAVGTDCLLPCRFLFASSVSIHWRKTPGEIKVHSYYNDRDQLRRQDPDYTDRTDLPGVIREGNATLRIKKVKVQDEGRYVCFTSTRSDSSISSVNLHVFVSSFVVNVEKQDSELVCHSEGVYPEPAVTWIPGLSVNQGRTTVHQREDQLYDIHSSVTLQSAFTVFSCNVSTAHYWKSTVTAEEYPVGVYYSDAVLCCPAPKVPTKSLIWTFNHTQTIVTQTGSELVFNDTWRPLVDALTVSNSLVLKDLTQDQEGFYSCRLNTDRQTFVTVIHLKIQLMQLYHEISENTAAELELMMIWIMGALFSYGILVFCFKEKGETLKKEQ